MTTDSLNAEFSASNRQATRRAVLFVAIAAAVLITGYVLVGDTLRGLAVAGMTLAAWALVQLFGILYLRTSPKQPAVGLSIAAGTSTVVAILVLTGFTSGWQEGVVVAGAWLACGAGAEVGRGKQWRKALAAEGTSGDIVRTLAVHAGYDGTPLLSFLAGGILVGCWAALLDVLPWTAPFAILVHVAAALGLSAGSHTRR